MTEGETETASVGAPAAPVSTGPVFGSAATFAGSGFGGFTLGATTTTAAAAAAGEEGAASSSGGADGDGEGVDPEAECQAEFKPLVTLEEVETKTGEEDEEEKFTAKAKLYRFDDGEWKERGVGPLKVLLHTGNGMMRILMRREKTLKICANHLVAPGTNLSPHMDSEKCFVWSAMDYADEEAKAEMFCIRFGSVEKASAFKEAVDEAERVNTEILEKQGAEGDGVADTATEEPGEEAEAKTKEADGEDDAAAKEADAAAAKEADALADKLESTAKVAEE